jgi:hypothetical protein
MIIPRCNVRTVCGRLQYLPLKMLQKLLVVLAKCSHEFSCSSRTLSNVVDWIGLAKDRYRWRALVNSVMNLRVP